MKSGMGRYKAKSGLVYNSLLLAFLGYWLYEHNDIYIAVAFVSFSVSTYFTWRQDKLESDPWSSESALSNVRICRGIGMLVFALSFLGFWVHLAVKT